MTGQFVRNTLPGNKIDAWDIIGIVDELIGAYPDIIGLHPDLLDMPITSKGLAGAWRDRRIDANRYS